MRFIVYAHPFNEESGGNVALWLLCERLRKLGYEAYIWPARVPYSLLPRTPREVGRLLRHGGDLVTRPRRSVNPFTLPIATRRMVEDAVVIYPEVIDGNPLRAAKVVRWFLHRPGHHTGHVGYESGELYFFYQDAFNDPSINNRLDNRLTVTHLHPGYREHSGDDRQGTCVLIRKGRDRLASVELRGDTIIDGLSHRDTAERFGRFEYLQSLDAYSMYSVFAAICGCVPVIEPVAGLTKEEWFPRQEDRYGLAYGWDDVDWAKETRPLLIKRLAHDREGEDRMVVAFAEKVRAFF